MKSELRARLRGRFEPPGDKSIGHRLALLAALASGRSRLEGFPPGQDCASTLGVLRALSVDVSRDGDAVAIDGRGLEGLGPPKTDLDCGNSGSTARMVSGILAGQRFTSRLSGDESLSRRPLDRVVVPLTRMGASIETTGGFLPMTVSGGRKLRGIDYQLPVASAQVKTAVLFAGLYADGVTRVREAVPSRNHTELALVSFGASPVIRPGEVEIRGGASLSPGKFAIPGDISSAAFFVGAAAFLAGSELVVDNVGLNPTRAAFLEALKAMGADIEVEAHPNGPDGPVGNEPQGRIVVRGRELQGVAIPRERVPALIDELPILAVVAAFASGTTRVEGASELRVKESDRLSAIVEGLRALGADVEELQDGFEIHGAGSRRALRPASLRSFGDHRMVMAWAVAALGVDGECAIDDLDQVKISYPGFWQTLDRLVC
jgi:3-phosphoshikimate 1-carboxyvinyltransferase